MDVISQRYRQYFEQALCSSIPSNEAYRPIRYHYGLETIHGENVGNPIVPGKLLRPLLTLLTFEGIKSHQQKLDDILPAAIAIEHLHNFSLIHDDIEDKDTQRHGKPALWTVPQWSENQAINAGDLLFALVRASLEQLYDRPLPIKRVTQAIRFFTKTTEKLIVGQYYDMSFERTPDVPLDNYFSMIRGKTSALIEASLVLPAIIASVDMRLIATIQHFGSLLGILFQLHDDFLGIWGDTQQTGKSNVSDLARKKKTFPVLYALTQEKKQSPVKTKTLSAYFASNKKSTTNEIAYIQTLLDTFDAKEATLREQQKWHNEAIQTLTAMPLSQTLISDFHTLADFFLQRDH